MRRVRYSVAASLDGYIAGPGGEYDWIVVDPDIDFDALMGRFDTILMGRASYEAMRRAGQSPPAAPGTEVYVFSRTLRQEECPDVTVSPDPATTVAALRQEEGKDIWLFGGGSLFRSLLEPGLVDSVEVAIVPILLGGGIPLLSTPAERTSLDLVTQRVYPKTGIVWMEYAVRKETG